LGFLRFILFVEVIKSPEKVGFCPLLFQKWAALKISNCNDCRVLCPLSHFFLLFNVIKKLILYINKANKSGQMGFL
jgi:hypothetical protein